MAGCLRGVLICAAALLTLSALPVRAQLADPTRPSSAMTSVAPSGAGTAQPAVVGLQSVIMRKSGKPAALINGEIVELGGMLGEAKVVRISEEAVVLRGPAGEETLLLTPAAEKKLRKDETEKKPARNNVKNTKTGANP